MEWIKNPRPALGKMKPVEDYTEFVSAMTRDIPAAAETWRCSELTLKAEKTYDDPMAVSVDLELKKGDRVLIIPGFYDLDNLWRVRFALPETGTWRYRVLASVNDPGLAAEGEILCTPYTGDLAIYRHGFVKTVPGCRHFVYDDGTPFFYLGDTHWNFLQEEYDEPGDRAGEIQTTSHFKYIINKRVAQGYTVYQTEPIGAPFEVNAGFNEKTIRGFQQADQYFRYIADQGMVHANAQFFFASQMAEMIKSPEYPKNLIRAARYWVARYGAYPVMWTLAQEIDQDAYFLFVMAKDPTLEDLYDEYPYITLMKELAKNDAYHHPLSAHQQGCSRYWQGTSARNSSFRAVPEHTWWASQWKPEYGAQFDFDPPLDYWLNGKKKPAVVYEGCYDHLWTNEYGARVQGWFGFLNGMYGYGYGAIDLWLYRGQYDLNNPTYRNGVVVSVEEKHETWGQAIEYPAGYQCGYLRDFFEQYEWWNLTPRFRDNRWFVPEANFSLATIGNDLYILMVYDRENMKTGKLAGLDPDAAYAAYWFDPRTGDRSEAFDVNKTNGTEYEIGERPTLGDWVLTVYKK